MKKNVFTICLIFALLIVSFFAGFSVTKSLAVIPLGFGGHLVSWAPCTCSGGLWLFYAPNNPADSSFPGGPLAYLPWLAHTYPYYNMVTPGVWHLGLYLPGVQSCWVWVGIACIPLPVLGNEIMVGTSLTPTPFN